MTATNISLTDARKVLARLTRCEVDGSLAADARRVLRDEADTLRAAIATATRHGNRVSEDVAVVVTEVCRVAAMWGVTV